MDETNFVTVEAPALIGVGAQSIVQQAKQLGLTWTFQPGTVGSVTDTMTTVMFDGDTQAINCVNLSDTNLSTGTRVMGIITPTNNYVIGTLGAKQVPASSASIETFGLTLAGFTSGSFTNITGAATATFVKRFTETAIKVTMDLTYYALVTAMGAEFAVQINGVDYVITRLSLGNSTLIAHTTVAGVRKVAAGLAAGSYTVTARVRATGGAGNINMDANDQVLVFIEECEA